MINLKSLLFTLPIMLLMLASAALLKPLMAGEQASLQLDSVPVQQWHFRVFVDDKEVGTHRFTLEQIDGLQHVKSVADFEYKWSFVTLYDYQHQNHEVWRNGCLARMESSTDANGKDYAVLGEQSEQGFVVNSEEGQQLLTGCVMSFAYWNPQFLDQGKLLNSQDGKYLEVEVNGPVQDVLRAGGREEQVLRYRLAAGKLDLELWYTTAGKWLALQSRTEGGRMLRYELLPNAATSSLDVVAQR